MTLNVKVLKGHSAECDGHLKYLSAQPAPYGWSPEDRWYTTHKRSERRDSLGRRNQRCMTLWLVYECALTHNCPAKAVVREGYLDSLVTSQLVSED